MHKLNDGQQAAKDAVMATINRPLSDTDKFHVLFGPAGTGKTFTIVDIIKSIDPNLSVCMSAPTHKAVKVLQRMAYKAGIDKHLEIKTIHSVLGLTMKQVEGDEVLYRDDYVDEKFFDVLIIDECSMIGDELLHYIIDCCSTTVIFLGDKCQISPVGAAPGEISKVFTEVIRQSELTEVMRQGDGNPIIDLATDLRMIQDDIYCEWPAININLLEDGSGVNVLPKSEWFRNAVEIFKSEDFLTNPDFCRCVAYTNDMVDLINDRVRTAIHGRGVADFLVGEVIVAQSSGKLHKNAEEMRILEIEEIDDELHKIPCYSMLVSSYDSNNVYRVQVVKSDYKNILDERLQSYANRAKLDKKNSRSHWRDFWALKKTFDDFKHIYAMSTHKSQGSTFDHTFVYTPDFLKFGATMEIKQLMYTGTTRSSFRTTFAY